MRDQNRPQNRVLQSYGSQSLGLTYLTKVAERILYVPFSFNRIRKSSQPVSFKVLTCQITFFCVVFILLRNEIITKSG